MAIDVLICDDSAVMRSMVKRALQMTGMSIGDIQFAEHGDVALASLREREYDLLLLDVNMPVRDGVSTLFEIRNTLGVTGMPVVCVTSEGSIEKRDALTQLGASIVSKPFTAEQLVAGIQQHYEVDMEWQTALTKQVHQVFETMLFAVSEGESEASDSLEQGRAVKFNSEIAGASPCEHGYLWVSLSPACAKEMIGLMIGDPDPTAGTIEDGVSEIANVIVGHLFLEHAADQGQQLGSPIAMARPDKQATLAEVSMSFDSGVAHVILSVAA